MKNTAALIIMTMLLSSLFAQEAETPQTTNPAMYEYCQIVGTGRLLSHRVTIEIDYGQHRRFFGPQQIIKDENDEIKKFNSMIDALNYMGEQGWEFVQAYAVSTGSNQLTYHYLLKKKIEAIKTPEE
jgi:hypothetical protein